MQIARGGFAEGCSFLSGVTFRFEAYKSKQTWTESHISRIASGNDLNITAGNDVYLVGGSAVSAGNDLDIFAGNDLFVTALAESQTSKSSSWGASLGFGVNGGFTIGGHVASSSSQARLYTNAELTAGNNIWLESGRNMALAGAEVRGDSVFVDAGNDFILASKQNTSSSQSSSFNFSVGISPTGVPTSISVGGSYGTSSRTYTDTPSMITAANTLDIYVGGTTHLLGAMLASDTDDLRLDTNYFVFDNYDDSDYTLEVSAQLSIGLPSGSSPGSADLSGSLLYENTRAITYATIGEGLISIRGRPDQDLSSLNRDTDNVQEILSHTYINIAVPGINLEQWSEQVEDTIDFFEAIAYEPRWRFESSRRTGC